MNDRREFQILIKGRKFGSAFRYNYIEGQSKILVALDASTIPLDQGDITCPDFDEPTRKQPKFNSHLSLLFEKIISFGQTFFLDKSLSF